MLPSPAQTYTAQHDRQLCTEAPYSTAQPSSAQHKQANTAQHSTAQHSTAQHSSRHQRCTYLKGLDEDRLCQPGRAVVRPRVVVGLQCLHNVTWLVKTRNMTGNQEGCIAAAASKPSQARYYFAIVQSRRLVVRVDCNFTWLRPACKCE